MYVLSLTNKTHVSQEKIPILKQDFFHGYCIWLHSIMLLFSIHINRFIYSGLLCCFFIIKSINLRRPTLCLILAIEIAASYTAKYGLTVMATSLLIP